MDPVEILKVARRYWAVVAAAVVLGVGLAYLSTLLIDDEPTPPSYQATQYLYGTTSSLGAAGLADPDTVAALVNVGSIPGRVATILDAEGSDTELVQAVVADVDEESGLLSIGVVSDSRDDVGRVVQLFGKEVVSYLTEERATQLERERRELQKQITALRKRIRNAEEDEDVRGLTTQLGQLESDLQASRAVAPDPGFRVVGPVDVEQLPDTGVAVPSALGFRAGVGAVLGLLGGLAIAFLLRRVDTRIRTKSRAEERFGLPVLAEIPVIPRRKRPRIIAAERRTSGPAEAFRILGAEVASVIGESNGKPRATDDASRVVLVTSAGPSEGKTTVVANLAVALAETGKQVLAVSCDFRRPGLHALFGVANEDGLADVLSSDDGSRKLSDSVQRTIHERVGVIASGAVDGAPGELLGSEKVRRVLSEARNTADLVLLDTAPILTVSDAAHLCSQVDAVLIVARVGRITEEVATRTSELLRHLRAPLIGVILNGSADIAVPRGQQRYYIANQQTPVRDSPTLRVPPADPTV